MFMTNEPRRHRNRWTVTALGALAWITWALLVRPEWAAVLLLLSPLVLLPLGLRLVSDAGTGQTTPALRTLGRLAPLFATAAAASFVPEPGHIAALLTIPWLAFTGAAALAGVGRVLSRRTLLDPGVGTDAGLMFLAVGGAWMTISRGGLNPLGFSDAIVQLTAVHFHYAGFALPIVAGFTACRLERTAIVPFAVIVGVPLTAAGITVGGPLEWVAATVMALAGVATAILMISLGARQHASGRWLITVAGAALLAGMSLAMGWAWSIRFGWQFLGLETMAATHGSLNALGFGLLGLVGLNLLDATVDDGAPTTGVHLGRPSADTLRRLAEEASARATTNEAGMLGRPTPTGFTRKSWRRSSSGGFETIAEAIRRWRGHQAADIRRWPAQPDIAVGETVALAIPVGPISVSATCRIVEVIDEPNQFGFIYATLPEHPEDGEESFIVTRRADGSVDVTVTAVWRPATIANYVCPPLTTYLQNRAINKYLDGIIAGEAQTSTAAR